MPKYPRTAYLPWSPGIGRKNDRILNNVAPFIGRPIVISEKLDGGNVTMTHDRVFARSHAGAPAHASFDLAKASHAWMREAIAPWIAVYFEYMFAVHTIVYDCLPSYLFVLAVHDARDDTWWSWSQVQAMAMGLAAGVVPVPTAPVLFEGTVASETELIELTNGLGYAPSVYGPEREGVVVRLAEGYPDVGFSTSIAKWVRPGHVQGEHWTRGAWYQQRLCE